MDTLASDIVAGLRRLNTLPVRSEARRDALRDLAGRVVDLRLRFETHDGQPDWLGTSGGYRAAIGGLYDEAGVDKKSVGSSLRYHIGAVLRERMPPEAVAEAGLMPNPDEVRRQRRRANSALLRAVTGRISGDAVEALGGIVAATEALRAVPSELVAELAASDDADDLDSRVQALLREAYRVSEAASEGA